MTNEEKCDTSQASEGARYDGAAIAARESFNNWTADDAHVVRSAARSIERRNGGTCPHRRPVGWQGEVYVWRGDGRCVAP